MDKHSSNDRTSRYLDLVSTTLVFQQIVLDVVFNMWVALARLLGGQQELVLIPQEENLLFREKVNKNNMNLVCWIVYKIPSLFMGFIQHSNIC